MPLMRILDSSGDTVVEWDRSDAGSVERARRVFCQLHAERRMAFHLPPGAPGNASTQIRDFDADLDGEIIWVRPVQGG